MASNRNLLTLNCALTWALWVNEFMLETSLASRKAAGQPGLTICKCGKGQPQKRTVRSQRARWSHSRRWSYFPGQRASSRIHAAISSRCQQPQAAAAACSEPVCGSPMGVYCCTFLLYSQLERSNSTSDLWS